MYDISGDNLYNPLLDHYFLNPWNDYTDGLTWDDNNNLIYVAGSTGI